MSILRSGRIVRIRVSPKNCMAVSDFMDLLQVKGDMSFSQVVSVALASAMEMLMENKLIPRRVGHEYERMMGKYPATEKERLSTVIRQAKALRLMEDTGAVPTVVALTRVQIEKRDRLDRLVFRHENLRETMTEAELDEMRLLMIEVKGLDVPSDKQSVQE